MYCVVPFNGKKHRCISGLVSQSDFFNMLHNVISLYATPDVRITCSIEYELYFVTGTGSVLNTDGDVEMDAVIMEGKNLNCGSVACIQNIKNPISVARLVMDKVKYIMYML